MKRLSASGAAALVKEGMTVMVGGFLTRGTPQALMDALVAAGTGRLTIIGNDGGLPGSGIGKLVDAGLVAAMNISHLGLNPAIGRLMNEGKIRVQLTPQGTLAEQVRAAGAGLGGVLTPTGIGTEVAQGKQVLEIGGKQYLLEMPVRADVALLRGSIVDTMGNVFYRGTTKNFNPLMAMAADVVIVEAERIVEVGELDSELIMTPGIFVDYVVKEGEA